MHYPFGAPYTERRRSKMNGLLGNAFTKEIHSTLRLISKFEIR